MFKVLPYRYLESYAYLLALELCLFYTDFFSLILCEVSLTVLATDFCQQCAVYNQIVMINIHDSNNWLLPCYMQQRKKLCNI